MGDPPVSPFRGLTVPPSALLGLELGGPVDFLLVSFERIGPLRPLLTGKVLVWGRPPAAFTELQSVLRTV